jgi:hypothetical protein
MGEDIINEKNQIKETMYKIHKLKTSFYFKYFTIKCIDFLDNFL